MYIRPSYAAVKDVADDSHLETGNGFLVLPDRHCVEQCLSRVLVGSVAGVDDRGPTDLCELVWNSGA